MIHSVHKEDFTHNFWKKKKLLEEEKLLLKKKAMMILTKCQKTFPKSQAV